MPPRTWYYSLFILLAMAANGSYFDLDSIKRSKGLKIIHVNIRSLLPKFTLFKYDFLDDKFDIVMVSETWLKQGIPNNLICVYGYNNVRKDRRLEKRGGGLCIYLRDGIVYDELFPLPNGVDKDLEWLCLKANIGGNKKQILLLLYRPPSGSAAKAIEYIKTCLEYFQSEHRNCELSIMGDLNFNYKNKNCVHVKSLKLFETLFGIKQLITSPTRSTLQTIR